MGASLCSWGLLGASSGPKGRVPVAGPRGIPRRELGFCRWARNCHRSLSTACARSCSRSLVGGSLASVSPINPEADHDRLTPLGGWVATDGCRVDVRERVGLIVLRGIL